MMFSLIIYYIFDLKKLPWNQSPQKIDTLAIVSILLPEY